MTAPVVYFIDDSATMREVIKIAFRRENMEVVACADGDSALAQMMQQRPDVVISDVIMPGKDGYEVCQSIKHNPAIAQIPVVLMSGVVNKGVAEKAFAVKADELIRKPFQPGDLIARVKQLLAKSARVEEIAAPIAVARPAMQMQAQAAVSASATLSSIFLAPPRAVGHVPGNNPGNNGDMQKIAAAAPVVAGGVSVVTTQSRIATSGQDVGKLRIEILRLEHLVKKLHSELAAEREYAHALEEHIKTLQETD